MPSFGMLRFVALVRVFLCYVLRLLVAANVVPSSPILVTLMTEAIHSSKSLVIKEPDRLTSQKTEFFEVLLYPVFCSMFENVLLFVSL
jgi:hypothetical protein